MRMIIVIVSVIIISYSIVSPFVCCRKVSPISVISTYPSSLLTGSNTSTLLFIKSRHIHEAFCGFSRSHGLLSPLQVTPAYIRHLSTEPCASMSMPCFLSVIISSSIRYHPALL